MRATLGAGLLLVSTMLVGLAGTPAEAATGCDNPDTTWVGPATEGGSVSWDETANWSNGVPTAASVVCIPATPIGPEVAGSASAGSVTLEGVLTVGTSFDVGSLIADGGRLVGGTTTVTESITGDGLTLTAGASVDGWGTSVLGDWSAQGSRLTVHGDAVLAPGAEIDTLGGLFTITENGSLTFDTPNESADVVGGFANHGAVTVTAGSVLMMGADPEDAQPDQFSTGTFTGSPEATFNVANTELRTGASLDHVTWVDHISVPSGSTATIADSTLTDMGELGPSTVTGAGHLLLTDGSVADAHIGGSLAVTIPAGEVASTGDAVVQDQARIRVDGELRGGNITLNDDAVLDVFGVHRGAAPSPGSWNAIAASRDDPGVEIIHPTGRLVSDDDSGVLMAAPFVNYGTVDSGTGFIYLGPEAESPSASSGTFRSDPTGTLLLGSGVDGAPTLVLDAAVIEGPVDVMGPVTSKDTDVFGELGTVPGGRLSLDGDTEMMDGSSIAGNVVVGGRLEADPGATGTATLSGAEVTGSVRAVSGTLSVPRLAPTTLSEDGTLTGGEWVAAPGATLDLPAITTNDTDLTLEGPGASFGELTALVNGPNGTLDLVGGADLEMPGRFRNEGVVRLSSGSRLTTGANFRQLPTGTLVTAVDAAGRGHIRAAGRRDLGGQLVVQRDPTYTPPVGTFLTVLKSGGRVDADDAFDAVISPRYGSLKLRVAYQVNRVRLWVDRVG